MVSKKWIAAGGLRDCTKDLCMQQQQQQQLLSWGPGYGEQWVFSTEGRLSTLAPNLAIDVNTSHEIMDHTWSNVQEKRKKVAHHGAQNHWEDKVPWLRQHRQIQGGEKCVAIFATHQTIAKWNSSSRGSSPQPPTWSAGGQHLCPAAGALSPC